MDCFASLAMTVQQLMSWLFENFNRHFHSKCNQQTAAIFESGSKPDPLRVAILQLSPFRHMISNAPIHLPAFKSGAAYRCSLNQAADGLVRATTKNFH